MKYSLLFLFLLFFLPSAATSYDSETKSLLKRLDLLIAHSETFNQAKEKKIEELQQKAANAHTQDERYWVNKMLYDEYFVYNADSAMTYVNDNLEIASRLGKKEETAEWHIKKSFLLAATGLLKEAIDELEGIDAQQLPRTLQVEYYGQMIYLYSHMGQYSRHDANRISQEYYQTEAVYKDSIYAALTPKDPYYLWYKGWKFIGTDQAPEVIRELKERVDLSSLETRLDAMEAYILARLCKTCGQKDEYLRYMICSAMADVRTVNHDIASLEELAMALFERGDIDRAYTYINYCLQHAQLYRNRVRMIGISGTQDAIRQAYQNRNRQQERRLHLCLMVVSVLSVVLLVSLAYIYKQMKKEKVSGARLDEANGLLNQHITELKEAHIRLEEMNQKLQSVNRQLKETNEQLRESNYIKEEYIGYVFTLCSNYINRMTEFRKSVNRKLKAGKTDEVQELTETEKMAYSERKEFYQSFDAIFLHVYPNFVEDFNALLQPEEQIVPKKGELLNTELRIYALVRLGINDSIKIAEFLHCSPQTVYNNRMKIRNKAIISKEDFAETVRSLGKKKEDS